MVAILDEGDGDIITRHALDQCHGMLPWHIRVLHALQDMHRAARLDDRIKQQILATILDQRPCDGIAYGIIAEGAPIALCA